MNKLITVVAATLIGLLVASALGYHLLVNGIRTDAANETAALAGFQTERTLLDAELKRLSDNIQTQRQNGVPGRPMRPGEEGLLLGSILAAASATDMIVQGFELQPSWKAKGDAEAIGGAAQPSPAQPAQLPQLDENGMPVGAVTDEGDEEWPGVEIVPASLKLKGTFPSFGRFFDLVTKKLPLSGIQTMSLDLDGSGIIRATLRMTFPVAGASGGNAGGSSATGQR
ncbi:MAG TPA: hypothetical protein PLP29_16855 [Candidatus Ozemobacteraceae bacterium]|nr:hypothetical protein [Candidatus Ozemobacteraceae bacterium]